jgi:hypothetical protein
MAITNELLEPGMWDALQRYITTPARHVRIFLNQQLYLAVAKLLYYVRQI